VANSAEIYFRIFGAGFSAKRRLASQPRETLRVHRNVARFFWGELEPIGAEKKIPATPGMIASCFSGAGVSWEASMRAIFIGIVILSASIAVSHTAEAQNRTQNQVSAPVGHRQPTQNDVKGDDQLREGGLAEEINKENRILDRALKGICRGC
jgi:hypothetical protein